MLTFARTAFTLTLLGGSDLVVAQEGESRWRLFKDPDVLSLYIADTDLGTDNIGSPRFVCEKGARQLKVSGDMDEKFRAAFADALLKDSYPRVDLVPPEENVASLLEPAYSEMVGWTYAFRIPLTTKAFESFKTTGIFRFEFNDVLFEEGEKAGVERIAEFHAACVRGTW